MNPLIEFRSNTWKLSRSSKPVYFRLPITELYDLRRDTFSKLLKIERQYLMTLKTEDIKSPTDDHHATVEKMKALEILGLEDPS
ncbi:hypothetical protein EVAR_26969_1 [Eumeta japonica]|uniref:Uncharacterized protein n=1 Tax=Eumeta variegata TaxID=151549 RepID=A0A4C1VKQ3_EUMVA|nr:hypothetical protein EVAR_26969_1 [Eumeta japonica]